MLIEPVKELAGTVGISQACNALDLPRSTLYYNLGDKRPPLPRPSPARKLSDEERQSVLDILHSERFVDKSPGEIYATLLYSESHFNTLKYRPEFPDRFGSIQDAVAFCNEFFTWYNYDHRHSGIAMLTPATIHYGVADMVNKSRQVVLAAAYERHPERFVKGKPKPRQIPTQAWINPPKEPKGGDGAVL